MRAVQRTQTRSDPFRPGPHGTRGETGALSSTSPFHQGTGVPPQGASTTTPPLRRDDDLVSPATTGAGGLLPTTVSDAVHVRGSVHQQLRKSDVDDPSHTRSSQRRRPARPPGPDPSVVGPRASGASSPVPVAEEGRTPDTPLNTPTSSGLLLFARVSALGRLVSRHVSDRGRSVSGRVPSRGRSVSDCGRLVSRRSPSVGG